MSRDIGEAISWSDREKDLDWSIYENRVKEMYQLIDGNDQSVLDFGAGQMYLRHLLAENVAYYPVDYVKRCEDTIVCDFNKKEFPSQSADVAFLSGILEYIEDPTWFLSNIVTKVTKVILSYSCLETFPDLNYRSSRGWLSNPTTDDIINTLHSLGFMLTWRNQRDTVQPLMCFIKASEKNLHQNFLCCGCGACANICPTDAICLTPDEDGFYRPSLDIDKCIQCEKCTQICPPLHPVYTNALVPACYAFQAKDEVRLKCASGGVFPLLAKDVLAQGGSVCGVAWGESFGVQHVLIEDEKEICALSFSKYLQSQVGYIFRAVRDKLELGKPLLFSGCPCQVAALYAFLGKSYDNLYTIDLLCHYSPSPSHFKQYLEDTFGIDNLVSYQFRTKEPGWSEYAHKVIQKDGSVHIRRYHEDAYQQAFHPRLMMSSSCENCRFCGFPRQGDISVGDFHAIKEHDLSLDDTKGTSVVLVNSPRGEELFQKLEGCNKLSQKVPLDWVMNNRISDQFWGHPARDRFYALTKYMPFSKAAQLALTNHFDIGIVGIWSVENYGSNLTYYALYQTIRDMGLEPLMIERPGDSPWKPRNTPAGFKHNPYRAFDLSPIYANKLDMQELNNRCEHFLVGSDQLFNSYLYEQFGRYISLDWVNDCKKKIAYAASFGSDVFWGDFDMQGELSYFLKKFDHLSFREDASVVLAKKTFGVESQQVLDPVFLCDRKYFDDLAAQGYGLSKDYMAAYILDPTQEKKAMLEALSNHLDLPFQIFTDIIYTEDKIGKEWGLHVSAHTYNEDWLRNIADSNYVITDSFHGVCFAIIYKKPFVAIANNGRGLARFTSLLKPLHLENRLVFDIDQLQSNLTHLPEIDYADVYSNLDELVMKSKQWLVQALNSVPVKAKSTFNFLRDNEIKMHQRFMEVDKFATSVSNRFSEVDKFSSEVADRFGQVDNFVASVSDRFEGIDQFATGVFDQFTENNRFVAGVSDRFEEINQFATEVIDRLGGVDKFVTSVSERFDGVDQFVDRISDRFREVDKFVTNVSDRFDGVDQFVGEVCERFREIDKFSAHTNSCLELVEINQQKLAHRIDLLEESLIRINSSKSYRLGRIVTFLPRKVYMFFRNLFHKQ